MKFPEEWLNDVIVANVSEFHATPVQGALTNDEYVHFVFLITAVIRSNSSSLRPL